MDAGAASSKKRGLGRIRMQMVDDLLEIRAVDGTGVEEIFGVYKACEDFLALGPVAAASREMVRADLEMSKSMGGEFCGISLRDGPLVGVLDFVPGNFRGQADTAYIALLMLGLSFRRRGIGSRVLALVESEVRKDPRVARIRIGVQVNNPSAIRFWQNRGFHIYAGPELLADQTTVYRLEKVFPPAANPGSGMRPRFG
jgi:ribosomal protein S18 acetylase RimI-like enzyme